MRHEEAPAPTLTVPPSGICRVQGWRVNKAAECPEAASASAATEEEVRLCPSHIYWQS